MLREGGVIDTQQAVDHVDGRGRLRGHELTVGPPSIRVLRARLRRARRRRAGRSSVARHVTFPEVSLASGGGCGRHLLAARHDEARTMSPRGYCDGDEPIERDACATVDLPAAVIAVITNNRASPLHPISCGRQSLCAAIAADHRRSSLGAETESRRYVHGQVQSTVAAAGGRSHHRRSRVVGRTRPHDRPGGRREACRSRSQPIADLRDGIVRLNLPSDFQYRSFHDTDVPPRRSCSTTAPYCPVDMTGWAPSAGRRQRVAGSQSRGTRHGRCGAFGPGTPYDAGAAAAPPPSR